MVSYMAPQLPEYPASPAPGLKDCAYCLERLPRDSYKNHLLIAHSDVLFQCDECDTYVDIKDFILHMRLHVDQYIANNKEAELKKTEEENLKKTEEEALKITEEEEKRNETNDEISNTKADPKPVKYTTVIKKRTSRDKDKPAQQNIKTSKNQAPATSDDLNEFSDHGDTEYVFDPLPESVFEAIEDSQDVQCDNCNDAEPAYTPEEGNEFLDVCNDAEPEYTSEVVNECLDVCNDAEPEYTSEVVNECLDVCNDAEPAFTPEAVNEILDVCNDAEPAFTPEAVNEILDVCNDADPAYTPEVMNEGDTLPGSGDGSQDSETGKKKKARPCPFCSKVYTARSSYFYHLKYAHRRSREHECQVCGRKFGTRGCLAQHMHTHSDKCRYECKVCGKKFRSSASLYVHEQTHGAPKTHACSQCQLSFRWRTHLERHMKRHAAEKTHECPTCGRAFTIHCDLLRHIRTHSAGEFKCDKCQVKFAQNRYLKVHMAKKHSIANNRPDAQETRK